MAKRNIILIAVIAVCVALMVIIGIDTYKEKKNVETAKAEQQAEEDAPELDSNSREIERRVLEVVNQKMDDYAKVFITKDNANDLLTDTLVSKVTNEVIKMIKGSGTSSEESKPSEEELEVIEIKDPETTKTSIKDLGDVSIGSEDNEPQDGQTLIYNSSTKTWENGSIATTDSRARNDISSRLSELSSAISEQNLGKYGFKVGDYFKGKSGYTYILADMDTFYGGYDAYAVTKTHHIGVLVDTHAPTQWSLNGSTTTGYAGSNLHLFLSAVAMESIKTDLADLTKDGWEKHLLSHQAMYTNSANAGTWFDGQYISALSETQVFGSEVWAASGFHMGEANKKLEIFDKYRYNEIFNNNTIWLRGFQSGSTACTAEYSGSAGIGTASGVCDAVGLILYR